MEFEPMFVFFVRQLPHSAKLCCSVKTQAKKRSRCGESEAYPRNTLLSLTAKFLHSACLSPNRQVRSRGLLPWSWTVCLGLTLVTSQ